MAKKIRARRWDRHPDDWYVEPRRVTEQLLRVERFTGSIHDPACGQGNVVLALRQCGYQATGSDKVRRVRGCEEWFHGERDFLAWIPGRPIDNMVFNPPYFQASGAEAFIRHALDLTIGKVCAFVDLSFLAGGNRARGLYEQHPPDRAWIITPRPSCPPGDYLAGGGPADGGTTDYCWLVWDNTTPRPQATVVGWLVASLLDEDEAA